MPDLVSRLRVEMTEGVTGASRKAAVGLQGMENKLRSVRDRLKSFKDFKMKMVDVRDLNKQVADMRTAMNQVVAAREAALAKLNSFGSARIAKGNPLYEQAKAAKAEYQKLIGEQAKLQSAIKRTEGAYTSHKAAAKQMGDSINGIRYDKLIAEEQRLQNKIAETNAAMNGRKNMQPGSPTPGTAPLAPGRPVQSGPGRRVGKSRPLDLGGTLKAGAAAAGGWGIFQSLRDGAMYGYDYQQEANKMISQGQVSPAMADELGLYAQRFAKDKPYVTPIEAVQIITEALKAGVKPEGAKAMLPNVAGLARFGDTDPLDAMSTIISTGYGFRMPMNTEKDAANTSQVIADKIAQAAASTRGGVDDYRQGLKYTSGFASTLGVSLDQTLALLATQIQSGMTGSEAGTALRSLLVQSVKPTIDARQALAELGLSTTDYATSMRDWTPAEAYSGMENRFGKMDSGTLEGFTAMMDKAVGQPLDEIQSLMAEYFIKATGADKPQDKEKVVNATRKFLESNVEEMDIEALIGDMQEKKVTPGQTSRIFGSKHGARLMSIMRDKMYQDMLAVISGTDAGTADAQAQKSLEFGVGPIKKIANKFRGDAITVTQAGMRTPGAIGDAFTNSSPATYGGGGKALIRPSGLTKPMRAAMGSFGVKAETSEAQSSLDAVQSKLQELNGSKAMPSVGIIGAEGTLSLLNQIANLIAKINSSSVSPPGMRAVHADVGCGHGW